MKTAIIRLTIFISSLSAQSTSTCHEKLSENYTKESRAFQIHDEVALNGDSAEALIISVLQKLDCRWDEANPIAIRQKRCRDIIPNKQATRACYLETNVGYFFVLADMMGFKNIIWNRWD